jgi:2-alkyl-3-oxoalkanoate reductase
MRCLVTGATGFLGGHLVQGLLAQGHAVRAFVRDGAKAQGLTHPGLEIFTGDIRDRVAVGEAVKDRDVIFHCAAASEHGLRKKALRETNLGGVRNLLDAMGGCKQMRLVHVSGLSVLGIRNLHPASEELPRRRSGDPEADIKCEIENLIETHGREHDLDAVILRPSIVYGPGDENLSQVLDAIRQGKFAYIGSRNNIVPLVHVSDFVQMAILAAVRPEARGRIYHVADGTETTIGEIVECLADVSGSSKPTMVIPYVVPYAGCLLFEWLQWLRLRSKPGPIDRAALRFLGTSRSVPIGRSKEDLGYVPRMFFRDGIAATYQQPGAETHEDPKYVAGA